MRAYPGCENAKMHLLVVHKKTLLMKAQQLEPLDTGWQIKQQLKKLTEFVTGSNNDQSINVIGT